MLAFLIAPPSAVAEGFIDDSTINGGIYYWQRDRDRKDLEVGSNTYGEMVSNLEHATFNANLEFNSGYAANMFGLDLAAYAAWELNDGGPAYPNEIGFSNANTVWEEKWDGDKSGATIYRAAAKFKHGPSWAQAGYIQPKGQSLLAPHWSFMPGTYRGIEAGANFDNAGNGALSFSYMWADEYKAPWYKEMYDLRQADAKTQVDYVHSLGAKYDFKNSLVLEAAFGQAADYMDQYFAKVAYTIPLAEKGIPLSYQFYAANDKVSGGPSNPNDVYDGTAWLQALTFSHESGPFNFRLEGTWAKAEGNQGYFLQRMTPSYASSNGRLDVWWDSRSDWNANGEKAVFIGGIYNLAGWELPELSVGVSYAYGWDAKPSSNPIYNQSQRLKESAINFDLMYQIKHGKAKDTSFKLHYTKYDNHSDLASYQGGFSNIFQDETDVKFIVVIPFSLR